MANLENTLLGNCTMTRFEVNRHMELIVKDLIVGNRRQVSDLAGMLNDLRKIDVIDEKLHAELKKTKAGRNMLTHEHDMDADLPHTLEAIKTMRLLATLTDPIDDPRWATKEEYQNFSWNFQSKESINTSSSVMTWLVTLERNTSSHQALWFDSLQTRLPNRHILKFHLKWLKTLQGTSPISMWTFRAIQSKKKSSKKHHLGWAQSLEVPGAILYSIGSD